MKMHLHVDDIENPPKVIIPDDAILSYPLRTQEMSSTEPVNNEHCSPSSASTCGLVGTLFPTSCRGRAEAFARRLHRRLTSLSGPEQPQNPTDPNETSWLQSTHHNLDPTSSRIHSHQPRHSPESDVYYDLDISPEDETDPESPEEMATVAEIANLLVNSSKIIKSNHDTSNCIKNHSNTDNESGYVFSSPLDGTPSDTEAYYDPESSETDKPNDYFDPISTSPVQLSNGDAPNVHKPPGRRRGRMNGHEGPSNDSSLSQNGRVQEIPRIQPIKINNSSDESLNDIASSLETTSPSHESLWSTFDESTVSQDDLSLVVGPKERLLKSHSDSELIPGLIKIAAIDLESLDTDEVDFIGDRRHHSEDYCDGVLEDDSLNDEAAGDVENQSIYSSKLDIPGALEIECPIDKSTLTNKIDLTVGDENLVLNSTEDVSRLLEELSATSKESFGGDGNDGGNDIGDDRDGRPQRVRRCSSLKTGKTPPGTPGRKKIVRFADVLGLDLADVRTFLDEIPKVPNSAYSDLIYDDIFQKDLSPSLYGSSPTNAGGYQGGMKPDRNLVPMFQQPGGLANFMDVVRDRLVCLENVIVQDPITLCLKGCVRVRNLDFHKSVHVRYTMDSWRTFSDLQALYVNGSCDGFSDKFTFVLYCHTMRIGQRLEMAVRFQCKGVQYWDNNGGANYCFQCFPMESYVPIAGGNPSHDWTPAFY